jgi:hypothetical protein
MCNAVGCSLNVDLRRADFSACRQFNTQAGRGEPETRSPAIKAMALNDLTICLAWPPHYAWPPNEACGS